TIRTVINTHSHEDHIGNNDLLLELCGATIFAHPEGVSDIRYPPDVPWYRRFMFGPQIHSPAIPIPPKIETDHCIFQVISTPGHAPDHICLFEINRKWLFGGDLYVAADLDSQLTDVNGPSWISSLESVLELRPECFFDGHGIVIEGAA